MLLNFAPVVAHEHFLHRGFLEFLASTARIRNKKKEGEEETSQHPPFFSLEEGRQRERKREMGRQATGSRGQKAFLCSSSAQGLGYQSCHTRGRELNKFPEDVGSRGSEMAGRKSGGMSAGKNETRSSSGKVVPAKQKTSPPLFLSFAPRVDVAGFSERRRDVLQPARSLDDKFSRGWREGHCAWPRIRHAYQFQPFFRPQTFAVGKNLDEWSDADLKKRSLSNSFFRLFSPLLRRIFPFSRAIEMLMNSGPPNCPTLSSLSLPLRLSPVI